LNSPADLSNLAVYGKIGLALDEDNVETQGVIDYVERYSTALRSEDSFCFIRSDDRLWTLDTRHPVSHGPDTSHEAA
jgi:hypothetical protein